MDDSYLLQCITIEKQYNQINTLSIAMYHIIKLTHCDETQQSAHDSQLIRAKENLKLSHEKAQGTCKNTLMEIFGPIMRHPCALSFVRCILTVTQID